VSKDYPHATIPEFPDPPSVKDLAREPGSTSLFISENQYYVQSKLIPVSIAAVADAVAERIGGAATTGVFVDFSCPFCHITFLANRASLDVISAGRGIIALAEHLRECHNQPGGVSIGICGNFRIRNE
jgi:hypothetical protein